MAQIGPAMTCNGYDPATGLCASKTVPSYVPVDQTDAYMAGQWSPSTASSTPQDASTPAAGAWSLPSISDIVGAFEDGLLHPYDTLTGQRPATAGTSKDPNAPKQSESWYQQLGDFFGLVTDLPRIGTIVIGGLFIAAGLFALAGGNKIIQVTSPIKGG